MENVNGDAGDAISNVFVVIQRMKHVLDEEENHEILQTDSTPLENILLDITTIFRDQQEVAEEPLKIWLQLLHNSLTEANSILHRYNPPRRQRCLDYLMCKPGRLSKQVNEWKVHFNYLFQGLQRDFSIFVTAPHSIHKNPMQLKSAQESIVGQAEESGQPRSAGEAEESESALSTGEAEESEAEELGQPLSKDEAWMLFRRIAFKDSPVSLDIEEYATNIADECKGLPLAITLVAAAMMGKTTVDEWRASLSSIKNADPSSPDTELHSCFDPKPLYQRLIRWSYDALPNSNVKNCFLYCAMYREKELIYVEELVQMWVAEGLVRSRQGSHLMDMAIGFSYVNLLVDRCFFQNASFEPLDWGTFRRFYLLPHPLQLVKVHDVIRSMAIYIGEEKENCVFPRDSQFPEIHNENCKRISVQRNIIKNLPTEFTCPKLVSLFLTIVNISEVPSEFLVSLTSLKVLVLNGTGGRAVSSIPSSVGQLKQLEFLSLRGLEIKDLPEDICHLSALQFLDLSYCQQLQSLPSKIGELKNLKYLNLECCNWVIPPEISQLTSLNTLSTPYTLSTEYTALSLEAESEASIWSLKGLGNLTTLRTGLRRGTTSSGIREGIMGTWLEMRHFCFNFSGHKDLPRDMQNMRKLQSFIMCEYHGLSLPDYTYKFHHLEYLQLWDCRHLRELSPLERLPNLKYFKLGDCSNLKELGIGNSGRASGFLMLKQLVIVNLPKLESIAGPSNHGVWNETILPNLCVLAIHECPCLNRLPKGMEKLVSLSSLFGEEDWWQRIIWEDDNMKFSLQKLFKKWTATETAYWQLWDRLKWDIFEYN